ncbi:hypothetical protein GOP47_0021273 [Adiantum capillus-veneris]|uniref:Uncharacterized protein n=1 Tax=Adiantum capillus-veneris TaxID=13818 RepID=A0A9D4UAS8_ADICA|nr:hypothetical protein GOP47_0021273 [Adiantum capillus-veneris]
MLLLINFKLIGGILRLLPMQPMQDTLRLKSLYLACIPMFVRVEYEDPRTFDEAIQGARAKSRKMKKKMETGLLQLAVTVASGSKSKQMKEHQEVKPLSFLDMHLIKARKEDARVEELEEVPTRAQKVQRGIFRVPPSLLPQEDEVVKDLKEEVSVLELATRKVVMVQELASSKEESDSSHSSNSSLDTDAIWEIISLPSRYETYDVFYVDEVMNNVCELSASHLKVEDKHSACVEMSCVNLPVEQPYQMSCDGESLLEEEVWFDCASQLIEEQVLEDDLQKLEAEAGYVLLVCICRGWANLALVRCRGVLVLPK